MNFGAALTLLTAGYSVTRAVWIGKSLGIHECENELEEPYIYVESSDHSSAPWAPTNRDLFADDWDITEDNK